MAFADNAARRKQLQATFLTFVAVGGILTHNPAVQAATQAFGHGEHHPTDAGGSHDPLHERHEENTRRSRAHRHHNRGLTLKP